MLLIIDCREPLFLSETLHVMQIIFTNLVAAIMIDLAPSVAVFFDELYNDFKKFVVFKF